MRKGRSVLAVLLAACMIVNSTMAVSAVGEANASPTSLTVEGSGEKTAAGTETGGETKTPETGSGENTGIETGAGGETKAPAEGSGENSGIETGTGTETKTPDTGSGEQGGTGSGTGEETGTPETGSGENSGSEIGKDEGTTAPIEGSGENTGAENGTEEEEETESEQPEEDGELTQEETDLEQIGESRLMSAANAGEPVQGGTDIKILEPQVVRQSYGEVWLQWKIKLVGDVIGGDVHQCKIYRSETEDGTYVEIGESEEFNPVWADDPMAYRDKTVGHETDSALNKTYYYKISVLYDKDNPDETDTENPEISCESALSAPVSNAGLYYYRVLDNWVGEEGYVGACIADENGNRLDTLNLKEGVPKKLKAAWVKADGSLKMLDKTCYAGWYLCDRYHTSEDADEEYTGMDGEHVMSILGGDKVQTVPEMEEKNGETVCKDWEVTVMALPGTTRGNVYYLSMILGNNVGAYMWQIPVRVEEGDGTVTQPQNAYLYQSKDDLMQAIRDIMVKRTRKVTIYAPVGLEGWQIPGTGVEDPDTGEFIPPDYDFEDIYDFHRERADMKPWEGDYLLLAIGKADEVVSYNNWLTLSHGFSFNQTTYSEYVITPSFITTRVQEDWVDQQIDKIIRQPGGALYNYQNASDFAKIKAAYNYVRNNVSYKGTTTPIYHTCYSALKNKQATCQGYALLFYRLARELGIPCRVLMGTDANAHTYNIVKLGDAWYYLDTNAGVFLQGENDFNHTKLQSHYLTDSFKAEYLSKISQTSYNGSAESNQSGLSGVQKLTDAEVTAIDNNITSASNLSASYTINGTTIKAAGTVKYQQGLSGYLGYEAGQPTDGYFLAVKLKADRSKFKDGEDGGFIKISWLQRNGDRKEQSYTKADIGDGGVNVILDVTEQTQNIVIEADYDTAVEEKSSFETRVYTLDLSGVKREPIDSGTGKVTAASEYGIEPSSPLIEKSKDGSKITVSYEAIAYSAGVTLPDQSQAGDPQTKSGNYVALQINTPECVKGTKMLEDMTAADITQSGGAGASEDVVEIAEDKSYIRFILPVVDSLSKEFTIRWGGSHAYAWEQKLTVKTAEDCILEKLNESALLPGSIALNGLQATMYPGQSQCIHTTINKKYEQDVTQLFYTSAASDVVAVNRVTGVMKALKTGTAQITVTAVDKTGQKIEKKAKITVKPLTAPAGMKVSGVKDTEAALSWKANPTGQYMEVYVLPYTESACGKQKNGWKPAAERGLAAAGMTDRTLASCSDEEKTQLLAALKQAFGGECLAEYVTSDQKSLTVQGLQPETEYVFYFRNASAVTAQTAAFAGAVSDKIKTKSRTFASIRLDVSYQAADGISESQENGVTVYTVTAAGQNVPVTVSYTLLDGAGNEITGAQPEFKNAAFKTGNQKIVSVKVPKNDKTTGTLQYGAQVGDAELFVTGKDSSGTVRKSDPVVIRVVKAPAKLTKKTTTLTIGQSIRLGELIGTDLKGSVDGMDLAQVDFAAARQTILDSGYFTVSSDTPATQDTEITPVALINGKNNQAVKVAFQMGESQAEATIKVKDMAAPAIGKVTVRDTSALIAFTPAATVKELSGTKYYSVTLTDKTTGVKVLEKAAGKAADQTYTEGVYAYQFHMSTLPKEPWSCEITGLSDNKQYEAVITAHFDAGGKQNAKDAKGKKFKTSKPLLTTGGSIGVHYINLDELREDPNAAGTAIDYDAEAGILLENNGTYVFMAQASNLARTLETDKLKWTISSGDKKAAKIKASSSTYEMQLTTAKTGTFTVTATSTVTKEALATFKVSVIPYQSGGRQNPPSQSTANEVAYVPENVSFWKWEEEREDAAC